MWDVPILRGSIAAVWLAFIAAASPAAAQRSQCLPIADLSAAPQQLDVIAGDTTRDRLGRVVAPVMLNGQGPYRFIVDTGANRSVIAEDVATALGLIPNGAGQVHSVHDVTTAPLVDLDSFQYGRLELPRRGLPVLEGPVLAGQHGLLGVDGLAGRMLRLDFQRRCIEISEPRSRMRGWTAVPGTVRFGGLILVPGKIRNVDVNILIDTGSDSTLANIALRNALRARVNNAALDYARAYSAGEPVVLDSAIALPRLDMQDVRVSDVLAFVGDFHIFDLWGLREEPTLLIGMDVLRRTRALAIDYTRGIVYFRIREAAAPSIRMNSDVSRLR